MPLLSLASAILVYDSLWPRIKSFLLGEWSSSSYPLFLFHAVALVSVVLYALWPEPKPAMTRALLGALVSWNTPPTPSL